MVNYYDVENDYLENNEQNKLAYNKVNKKVKLLSLKDRVNHLNIDVDIVTTSLLGAIRSDRLTKMKSQEIHKIWVERITPQVNELNKGMREYPDEIQSSYYRINDMIDQIRNIHEEFIDDFFKGNTTTTVTDLDEINRLEILIKELGTSSKEFLEDYLIYKVDSFKEPKYKEDYFDNIVWSGIFFTVIAFFIVYRSSKFLKEPVRLLEGVLRNVNNGDLPDKVVLKEYDYRNINHYLSNLTEQLRKIQKYSKQVVTNQYSHSGLSC